MSSVYNKILSSFKKYLRFIGPGLMVSVAYMDPGNYSTAVAAGLAYKYSLLFSILLSNCLACFLQILAAKLGAVTGLDLATNCRVHFSYRVNMFIYILTEIAIIATDLAEVVGTAIALNILFGLPLFAGVVITVVDVIIVLMAYRPNGPLYVIRIFESFVLVLVGATVVCFGIELYQVSNDSSIDFSIGEILRGFLPNENVVDMSDRKGGNGLYLSLAILGATVMPHSLYLGSGLVQSRLKDFDIRNGFFNPSRKVEHEIQEDMVDTTLTPSLTPDEITPIGTPYQPPPIEKLYDDVSTLDEDEHYRPSVQAINDTMTYTMIELVVSLFTVALFVNAAILIVAGATLHSNKTRDNHDSGSDSDSEDYENADLFTIYNLLTEHLSPTAGFVFALALLCSGQSAGVVCTLAGQMVSEGFLSWTMLPVLRRLITRGLAIAPCLFVVSFTGREGLAKILNLSQVVLSFLLPVVSAPLIYFTCSKHIMKVPLFVRDGDEEVDFGGEDITNLSTPKFKISEPAIRLQDLRSSHPCAGWEEDEEPMNMGSEAQQLLSSGSRQLNDDSNRRIPTSSTFEISATSTFDGSTSTINEGTSNDVDIFRVKGYKDYSNGPLTALTAILIWGFITCLNLFLIGSLLLGYEVPF